MILASDLDGTLLQNNTDNMISRKDIDSIRRFRAAGNQFGLVTGRSPKLIANIFRKTRIWNVILIFFVPAPWCLIPKDPPFMNSRFLFIL